MSHTQQGALTAEDLKAHSGHNPHDHIENSVLKKNPSHDLDKTKVTVS